MKKICCLLLLVLAVWGCKKGVDNSGPKNPIYNEPIDFEVTGVHNVTMEQADTVTMEIDVVRLSGDKELVSLEFVGLPFDVNLEVTPQVDSPSYHSVIRFKAINAALGTYNVKITAHGTRISKDYYFTLHVIPPPVNPAAALVGGYVETDMCSSTGNRVDSAIVSIPGTVYNTIRIKGIWVANNSFTINATINPANHTIDIPFQSSNGENFSGTGTYTTNHININYRVTGMMVNDTCTAVLSR